MEDDTPQAAPWQQVIYVQAPQPVRNPAGTWSFWLGLLSFLFIWLPGISSVLAIAGIITGIVGTTKRDAPNRGLAIGGLVLSCASLLIQVAIIAFFVVMFSTTPLPGA